MPASRPPIAPALLLGLGFGGFVDGILLHQVLQWHHMVSAERSVTTVAGLEANTVADGVFHIGSWLLVAAGVLLTLRGWRLRRPAPPWRWQLGLLLAGWGTFNLVEGTVDHLVLGVHHVRDDLGGPVGWDVGFLVLGAAQLVVGLLTARQADTARSADPVR